MKTDKRPDPKPRKHAHLWQAYLFYDEITRMGVRHKNRLDAVIDKRSNMDAQTEQDFLEWIEKLQKNALKVMTYHGEDVGCIWDWVTSIRGIGDNTAARLLAQIDDIALFDTVSKLWRFAGMAVIDGRSEHSNYGETSHYNRRLKSVCWEIGDQFVRQQTPVYADIYYAEKERLRILHPEVITNGNGKKQYNDGHLHNMAKRKAVKIFLQHLWVKWRECEGLPVSQPYVQAILGHTHIIEV